MNPVLILCFARMDTLRQTLESVLSQPHGLIYVSCDGPTQIYERACTEVREYLRELLRLGVIQHLRISEVNEGTLIGVSKGIDWFFEHEVIGVIVEDDLVFEPRLLEAVEKSSNLLVDRNVLSIGLYNRVPQEFISENSKAVRRSRFVISCGWVTTRDEWNSRVTAFRNVNYWRLFITMIRAIGTSSALYHLWFYRAQLRQERLDARKCNWDDLWQINCFLKNKVVAVFNRNLITNIGDGIGSTHTFGKSLDVEIIPISDAEFNSVNFWALPLEIDSLSDSFFLRERKVSLILREKIRIRTRLGLR